MKEKERVNEILERADAIRAGSRTSSLNLENYLYYQELKLK